MVYHIRKNKNESLIYTKNLTYLIIIIFLALFD